MSNPWPKVYRQLLLLWVCVGTSLKHWQNQNDFPILPMTSQRYIYWQSAQARLDLAWHAHFDAPFAAQAVGSFGASLDHCRPWVLSTITWSVSEITKHVGWAFLLCFSGGTGRKLYEVRGQKIAGSVTVPERSSPGEASFPMLVSSLVPHLFRWGETATSSLVPGTRSHWDLGGLDRCQKLESDSLGLGRRMGVLHPCVNRQKSSPSPESRFLSYEACSCHPAGGVVHPSEGLGDGTMLAQGQPPCTSLPGNTPSSSSTWPFRCSTHGPSLSWRKKLREEFSLPAPTAAIVRGGASTARSVL